nr:poly (ADP ribose) polymerase [Hymenolepis microstoma]
MPALLDNLEVIKSKLGMLEDLLKIEVAYSLMKTGNSDATPIDKHYEKVSNRIEPMDRESEEIVRIAEYLRATHAPTHSTYTLDIVDIFALSKEGEAGKFKALDKRTFLWRGSRRTKIAGILQICLLSPLITVTLLLLLLVVVFCNVALGKVKECFSAKKSQLAKKFNSHKGNCKSGSLALIQTTDYNEVTWLVNLGVGATAYYKGPETGVVYPIGEAVTSADIKSDLLYNEYIPYDTAQIQQRYLVWVDFKYKFYMSST